MFAHVLQERRCICISYTKKTQCSLAKKQRQKHRFGLYILGSQSIWSLHFGSSQFGPCYFQLAVNLVPTVNLVTENVYMANGVHSWHI